MTLWTIGHSNRSLELFLSLLQTHAINRIADIRRYPNSRRNSHFNSVDLAAALSVAGIEYLHLEGLGGRRAPLPGSSNTALRSEGFRGYADYMQTPAFQAALARMLQAGDQARLAYLCAEALPWHCHRNLVSDLLVARGHQVLHILSAAPPREHTISPYAQVSGENVSYPGLLKDI